MITDSINNRDMRRQEAINKAIEAADRIILEHSDGSVEETNYLTSAVAVKWAEKVHHANQHDLARYDLNQAA